METLAKTLFVKLSPQKSIAAEQLEIIILTQQRDLCFVCERKLMTTFLFEIFRFINKDHETVSQNLTHPKNFNFPSV